MSLIIEKNTSRGWETIKVFEEGASEREKRIVYKVNANKKIIRYFPKEPLHSENIVNEVVIKGFSELPPEFREKGTIKASDFIYQINKIFKDKNIRKITIDKNASQSQIRSISDKKYIILSYTDFQRIVDAISSMRSVHMKEISAEYKSLLYSIFPETVDIPEETPLAIKSRLMASLQSEVMTNLSKTDITKILDFVLEILSSRYSSSYHRHELFNLAKSKVDKVAIQAVVTEFEEKMRSGVPESEWGIFIKKNLSLIFRHYIQTLPQLNLITASARPVDFGAVDAFGYLDIIEIKKPETKLLAFDHSHDNYYFHSESAKAITQAEKYLFHTERKASDLVEDIKNAFGIEVQIVRPNTLLILGDKNTLTDDKQRQDFRINRQSLKNIEIITYDELLQSLKNQLNQ